MFSVKVSLYIHTYVQCKSFALTLTCYDYSGMMVDIVIITNIGLYILSSSFLLPSRYDGRHRHADVHHRRQAWVGDHVLRAPLRPQGKQPINTY